MLRSRTTKAERASGDCRASDCDGLGGAAESQEITGRKVPRDEGTEDADRRTRVRLSNGAGPPGAAGGDGGLSGVVWWLAGLSGEREDVFRAVVQFL